MRVGGLIAGFLGLVSLFLPWYEGVFGGLGSAQVNLLDFLRPGSGVGKVFYDWLVWGIILTVLLIVVGSILAWVSAASWRRRRRIWWTPTVLWLLAVIVFAATIYLACKPISIAGLKVTYNCLYTEFMGAHIGVSLYGPGALVAAAIIQAAYG